MKQSDKVGRTRAAAKGESRMFECCHILIVEDTARSLITISSYLNDLGVSHTRNTTGVAVVHQAVTIRPDLIMLNVDLPDADAISICQQLRRDERTNRIPIIATADACLPDFIIRLREAGFSDCLCKPLSRAIVVDMLERHLHEDGSAASPAQTGAG